MKKTFLAIALVLTSSTAVLADDCSSILGNFQCSMQGEQVPLSIRRVQADTLKVSIADEGDTIITDGVTHKSPSDDSEYTASCMKDTGLKAVYTFKNTIQSISIKPSGNGVTYSVDRGGKTMSLNCVKE